MQVRRLPVKLTDEEMIIKGQELAELESELTDLESLKRAASKSFAKQIEVKKGKIQRVSHAINTKQENREVECEEVRDEESLKVSIVRKDTGEVVSERLMTDEERQKVLNFLQPVQASDGQEG